MSASSLFIVTTTHKNDLASAETLLLSSDKVVDFYEDETGGTVFYYDERTDRRVKTTKWRTAINGAAFHALLRGAENEQYIYVEVTRIKNIHSGAVTIPRNGQGQTYRINISRIIQGKDRDTRSSNLLIERGPFEVLEFRTSHTIEEIDNISSVSYSISASGSL